MTAPREGTLNYQWRMTGDGHTFGHPTPNLVIDVRSSTCASLREQQRQLVARADQSTAEDRRNPRPGHRLEVERILTDLSRLTRRAAERRCAVQGDQTFPLHHDR